MRVRVCVCLVFGVLVNVCWGGGCWVVEPGREQARPGGPTRTNQPQPPQTPKQRKPTHDLLDEDEEGEALLVGHGGEGVVRVHPVDVGDEGGEPRVVGEGHDAVLEVGPADAVVGGGVVVEGGGDLMSQEMICVSISISIS